MARRRRWVDHLTTGLVAAAFAIAFLVAVGPRMLPYKLGTVVTGSMEPTIPTGSLLVLDVVDGSSLQTGDIITFQPPDDPTTITHRIVDVEETADGRLFVTKGDANASPDAWRIPAVQFGTKYRFHLPYVGYLVLVLHRPMALMQAGALLIWLVVTISLVERFPATEPART